MTDQTYYQQLAEAVGTGDSKYIPQIFEVLANEKEAQLLLAASPPATAAELSERTGLPQAEIEEMVTPLFVKGLLLKSKKPEGIRYYRVRHFIQMHDATAVMIDAPREMLDQEALCPFCQVQFRLRLQDSVEYREEKAKERARREMRAGQLWLRWAIAAAVVVVLGLVLLIVFSFW